jgi:hypothetical protein
MAKFFRLKKPIRHYKSIMQYEVIFKNNQEKEPNILNLRTPEGEYICCSVAPETTINQLKMISASEISRPNKVYNSTNIKLKFSDKLLEKDTESLKKLNVNCFDIIEIDLN